MKATDLIETKMFLIDVNMEAASLINAKVELNESPVNTLMMVNKSNKSYKHEN